jgi:hypothetical protein
MDKELSIFVSTYYRGEHTEYKLAETIPRGMLNIHFVVRFFTEKLMIENKNIISIRWKLEHSALIVPVM